jgi:predicted GIY-YIG superfamily endonuclease
MWFYVYVLRCSDGSFYTGYTSDLKKRIKKHQQGGSTNTKNRRPVELCFACCIKNKYIAIQFEKYLKTGSGRGFMNKHFWKCDGILVRKKAK